MNGIALFVCCLFLPVTSWAQNIVGNPTGSQRIVQPAGTEFNVNRFEVIRYVDPTNSANWSGAANCTIDLGTCLAGAIADLPTTTINGNTYRWGTIHVAAGDYNLLTTVTPGPLVSIEMAGPNAVRITSGINGDAFDVRDSPFSDSRGSSIGGFTLIGPGSGSANAVGIHTGDLNFGHFHDIAIGGFMGSGSSCFWVDDQTGWFERNLIEHVSLGEVQTLTGTLSLGCTKHVRFTGNSSFGYNEWLGLRLSPQSSGQIGFSLEAGSLYNNHITGNANISAGATLFSVVGSGGGGNTFIDFRAECTLCTSSATGWSIASGLGYSYTGPGIVTGQDPHIVDSISGNLVPVLASDTKQSAYAAGAKMLWIPTISASSGQINEAIGLGDNETNWGSGIGGVRGPNIAHTFVWGYLGDSNCFEVYKKSYRTPLTAANRIATLPCGLNGIGSNSNFVLDNTTQTLTNKTLSNPTVAGTLVVAGNLTVSGAKQFRIDHPLDPVHKYLYHTAVESPDMKNIYDGVVFLGEKGEAEVTLPDWFEALNRDFRYQLTCIGDFAPLYIKHEIQNNRFWIAGGRAGIKVSWQVTGIRHDAYADSHPAPVEQDKPNEAPMH